MTFLESSHKGTRLTSTGFAFAIRYLALQLSDIGEIISDNFALDALQTSSIIRSFEDKGCAVGIKDSLDGAHTIDVFKGLFHLLSIHLSRSRSFACGHTINDAVCKGEFAHLLSLLSRLAALGINDALEYIAVRLLDGNLARSHSVAERTFQHVAIGFLQFSPAVVGVILEASYIVGAIGRAAFSLSFALSIDIATAIPRAVNALPISLTMEVHSLHAASVGFTIGIGRFKFACGSCIGKVAFQNRTISQFEQAFALQLSEHPVAFVGVAVGHSHLAQSAGLILLPVAAISTSVSVGIIMDALLESWLFVCHCREGNHY